MLFGKYLNKLYLKYFIFYLIGLVGLILVDYFQLYIPEYLGKVVNLTQEKVIDLNLISKYVLIVVFTGFVMFLGRIMWRISIFHASLGIEATLRHNMFLKAERLSQRYYHENKVGNIMAWFTTDLETIEEFLGWGFIMLFDAIFLSALVIIKMFMLDYILALIALIPMVLIIIWGALVEKFMSLKWEERQSAFDELYDFSQENFTGIRVIKAFVKGNSEIAHFKKIAKNNQDVNINFARISVIFDVLIKLIIMLIMALILGLGGYFVYMYISGDSISIFNHTINLSSGELVTFIGYFETAIWPMMAMGQIVAMRSRAKTSYKRVEKFLDEEEEITLTNGNIVLGDIKGKVTFNHFNFSYPKTNSTTLKDITFEIKPGEIIGVVGKIGSGKTTLVNSLLRLYNIDKSSIYIDDNDIMDCNIKSLRDNISYVPQDNFLFSDKIKNNISFFNQSVNMNEIIDAAKFSDVEENILAFKDQYDTITGERGVSLSGGQKQRISISRAYIKNSPIMILDDSVSAVDVKTEENILNNIRKYRKNKTTIIIASRVSTVENLNKILVLNDGCVEAFDTHENLLKTSPTYSKMVYLQTLERELSGGENNGR